MTTEGGHRKMRTPRAAAFNDSAERIRRRGLSIREYLTTCGICRTGVYRDDDSVRIVRPVTGLVHQQCAPEPKTEDR
jgi:hypothetical protein